MSENKSRYELNRQRELDARRNGIARAKKRREEQAKRGDLSSTTAGMMTSEAARDDVVAVLCEYIQDVKDRKPKVKPLWFAHFDYHPVEKTAELALRCCLDAVGAGWTRTNLIMQLANALNASIMNEVLLSSRDGQQVLRDIKNRVASKPGATRTRREYAIWLAGKRKQKLVNGETVFDDDAYFWEKWDETTSVKVGGKMLSAVFEATNLFENDSIKNDITDKHPHIRIKLTEEAQKQLAKLQDFLDAQSPQFGPMFKKPFPWDADSLGPYEDVSLARLVPPVKHMGEAQEQAVWAAIKDGTMDDALEALNTLQEVPYAVNDYVVGAVEWVYKNKLAHRVNSFPAIEKTPEIPDLPKPVFRKLPKDEQLDFGREQLAVRKGNLEVDSNILGIHRNLKEAANVQDAVANGHVGFYLPHQWDYRGRVYHTSEFGTHNTDYLRAMFMFANKAEVTPDNVQYLTLQLANTYGNGVDKETLAFRKQWAVDNEDIILACGKDYKSREAFAFWTSADDPFQFLAACHEWYNASQASEKGEAYYTGLPIALDATQSGIQVYAALGRNKEDGEKVNITANERPGDLYTAVMNEAQALIDADIKALEYLDNTPLDEDDEDEVKDRLKLKHARQWLAYGLSRKVCKRNTMCWAYSSRRYGFAEQLRSDLMEGLSKQVRRGELKEHPFGIDRGWGAAWYMAGINEQAIRKVVMSAADGMDFFQDLVALCNEAGIHLTYTTPLGFPMYQNYRDKAKDNLRIDMPSWDRDAKKRKTIKADLQHYTDDVAEAKSKRACAPNLIHSLDATILMKAVLLMRKNGATDIMTVHDSFSTTIDNVGLMAQCIRLAFYDLFNNHCPYTELLEQTLARLDEIPDEIPRVPDKYDLDISEILKSDYAFS